MEARESAGLSPWQTVSNVEEGVTGVVKVVNLEDIQGEIMSEPTILISDQVCTRTQRAEARLCMRAGRHLEAPATRAEFEEEDATPHTVQEEVLQHTVY
jgi:hypothetical protein